MIKRILKSELGKGAFILFFMMNIFNFLNFVFHFTMGRLLTPADYGVLAVLMSLIYIYNVPIEALQNITSKYASIFNSKKEPGKIKFISLKILKRSFGISIIIFLLAAIISIYLSKFLEINFWLIIIADIYILFAFTNPIIRGILQGRKKFGLFGGSMIIEAGTKIIISVLLVFIGFRVFGAITGVIIGGIVSFIFAIIFNKSIFKTKTKKIEIKEAYSENIHYFIAMLIVFVIFSVDILLAKRFFSADVAGQYAVLSMLGKMIFLATLAISKAMFPLVCESHDCEKPSGKIFLKSFATVGLLCLAAILTYLIFPKLIIFILYGKQYLEIAPYLFYSGLAFSFLSLGNLVLIYGLSKKRLKKSSLLIGFIIITLILLGLFHENIFEFILWFMVSNLIFFIGSLIIVFRKRLRIFSR